MPKFHYNNDAIIQRLAKTYDHFSASNWADEDTNTPGFFLIQCALNDSKILTNIFSSIRQGLLDNDASRILSATKACQLFIHIFSHGFQNSHTKEQCRKVFSDALSKEIMTALELNPNFLSLLFISKDDDPHPDEVPRFVF